MLLSSQKRMIWRASLGLAFLCLGRDMPLSAGEAGSLSGRTTDPQGSVVAGATLRLIDSEGATLAETRSDVQGGFEFKSVAPGQYRLVARATSFAETSRSIWVVSGQETNAGIQFLRVASGRQEVTVVASAPAALAPDPSETMIVHDGLLEANPGRPGAPISIPGLPIESASGGIKAPQYFAPGVAGDHGEPIAQYYQLGDFLYPNNLPANAHGNGYADPNFLISKGIGTVQVDGGAFNVREGNHAVNLAVAYSPRQRLEPFVQFTGDYHDFDVVTGASPGNPDAHGWVALETSFGNGYLARLEHRQQYKLNAYRAYTLGRHSLTLFGIGYYGTSEIPGLIPTAVPVPDDTVDPRQLDRTHTTLLVATDSWQVSKTQQFQLSGFFRTYNLTLRSNFGDGLIQQSEFRTVAGGETSYIYKIRPHLALLTGVDLRRDAPRDLDLKHLDSQGIFRPVTSNDLTLGFVEPFASLDGSLGRRLHYDLGVRQEEVSLDNRDKINPANSLSKLSGIMLPKGTLTLLPPENTHLPTVAFSVGETFHTNDPRIGVGTGRGTVVVPSRAYQLVVRKQLGPTELKATLARVTNSSQLAKIDPDTGLQQDVGPSIIRSVTLSARRYFSFGMLEASWARAMATARLTGADIPEAPRLIWDLLGATDHLPFGLRARGEFEYVGRKPLGDGFTAVPVREIRGSLLRNLNEGRMDLGVNFLLASGFTGQTLETLALPTDSAPFERIVGVPLKPYVSVTWTYNFGHQRAP